MELKPWHHHLPCLPLFPLCKPEMTTASFSHGCLNPTHVLLITTQNSSELRVSDEMLSFIMKSESSGGYIGIQCMFHSILLQPTTFQAEKNL